MMKLLQIRTALIACALILTMGLFLLSTDKSGPQYRGRSISYWLEVTSRDGEYIDNPFSFVGPEAAPILAAVLQRADTTGNTLICSAWERLPTQLRRVIPKPILNRERRRAAVFGLLQMREKAASQRAALVTAAAKDSDARVRELAQGAIDEIDLSAQIGR